MDHLLDAAESGIRLRGYHAVSFRELADELGIKSASVHYYFRQKEDLGLALVQRYSARFFEALSKRTDRTSTPEEKIAALCATYKASLDASDKICLCGMLGAETCGLPQRLADEVTRFFDDNIKWAEAALDNSIPQAARKAKATQIIATLQGAMMLATSLRDTNVFNQAVKAIRAELKHV